MGIRATTAWLLIDGLTIILVDASTFWWGTDQQTQVAARAANSGQFSSSWNNGQILVEKQGETEEEEEEQYLQRKYLVYLKKIEGTQGKGRSIHHM